MVGSEKNGKRLICDKTKTINGWYAAKNPDKMLICDKTKTTNGWYVAKKRQKVGM